MSTKNTLISACKVHSKGHVAVVQANGGYITPHSSTLARTIQQFVQIEIVSELGAVHLYLENGTYIGYAKNPATRANTKQSRAVFDACETTVGGGFGTLRGRYHLQDTDCRCKSLIHSETISDSK